MAIYLVPGVHVAEVSFAAHPIDGVPTSTRGFPGIAEAAIAHHPLPPPAPWTDGNRSDPGTSLLQAFAWLGDATQYRMDRLAGGSHGMAFVRRDDA